MHTFLNAAVLILLSTPAAAMVAGVPAPGSAAGIAAVPYTIWSAGPFSMDQGQVLAGLSNDGGRTHCHFVTSDDPDQIWWAFVNTSAGNDAEGARAHTVAVTWYPAEWGSLPSGTPFPGVYDLPRPGTQTAGVITGGQTVTNSWGNGLIPYAGLLAVGLLWGDGWVPVERGGLPRSTKMNLDLVVQAVGKGSAYVLGTSCYAIRVR